MTKVRNSLFYLTLLLVGCGGGSGVESVVGDCPFLGGTTSFNFIEISDAPLETYVISNEVTIRCGSALGVRISGGAYSINGGEFTSAQGTIRDGQRLRVRVMSASTFGTTSTASVQVGNLGTINVASARFDVTTMPGEPANAPTATVIQPTENTIVNASRITVSGHANDPDGISQVLVNGVLATTDDDYAAWIANIPLVSGTNTITVSTADSLLNINPEATTVTIDNLAVIASAPVDIVIDAARARALVIDSHLPALIAIDLVTGEHALVSGNQMPDNSVPFGNPTRISLNALGESAWIIDNAYDDLIAVDLATGERVLLVDTSNDAHLSVADGRDLALDETSNRALVLAGTLSSALNDTRIISINLADGSRYVLSDDTVPDTDNPFGSLFHGISVAFDSVGYRLLVFQEENLLAVDPLVGLRTVFSETGIDSPTGATLDLLNNRVLVLSRSGSMLYGADLNSGNVETLWLIPEFNPQRVAFDPINNRTLVLFSLPQSGIFAIDMLTGEFSIAY